MPPGPKLAFTAFALVATGCLRTSVVVQKFNEGAIETGGGDPARDPVSLRFETAQRRIEQELIDAYFGQNHLAWPQEEPRVVHWLRRDAAREVDPGESWFSKQVRDWLCAHGKTARVPCSGSEAKVTAMASKRPISEATQSQLRREVSKIAPLEADAQRPLCDGATGGSGTLDPRATGAFLDTIRYRLAVSRAVESGAALVDEGQVPLNELSGAASAAFQHAAEYLARRRWERSFRQPTAGLVVKGGASTGIFSAGAVWVALNIEHECLNDAACKTWTEQHGVVPRFDMMSGTSTGAMVVSAADAYYASKCTKERDDRLELFQRWFVCSPAKNLYCAVDGNLTSLLFGEQQSLLEFDGLRYLLSAAVDNASLENRSELLLNAVDFRTGRLYTLSDQDQLRTPAEVASAAIASAALPLIVRPEPHFPGEPVKPARPFAYLDGGIRSELPMSAAIRRGAERLLVVSSSPSVMGETGQVKNGLAAAVRYIDVSTGGVLESEIDWAPRLAEGRRLTEYIECRLALERSPALCPPGNCNGGEICRGNWEAACTTSNGARQPSGNETSVEAGAPVSGGGSSDASMLAGAEDPQGLIAPLFRATSIYRDERRVPGLPGYTFRRADQRKLFLAGSEEARQRCFEIAETLGLPIEDPALAKKLIGWCTPKLKPLAELCGNEPPDEGLRSCSEPVKDLPTPTARCP